MASVIWPVTAAIARSSAIRGSSYFAGTRSVQGSRVPFIDSSDFCVSSVIAKSRFADGTRWLGESVAFIGIGTDALIASAPLVVTRQISDSSTFE
jgi:hypothetical protein